MHREVRDRHVAVHSDVDQIAHLAIEPGLFEKFTAAGLAQVLALFDAASGEHAIAPTVLESLDHEHLLVEHDDCR
ncbi:hypothetical protein ASF23_17620 [Curtobacterium sp. Leaf261]|nr:hypothetical protein ASF23_17620 [Curtobacterium sp. Leaf261]